MNIRPAKDATKRPATRRELLAHLWGVGLQCNVFKEGAHYAVTAYGRIAATHARRITQYTFDGWAQVVRDVERLSSQ